MLHEELNLLEGPCIEQEIEPLAGRELAEFVLLFHQGLTAMVSSRSCLFSRSFILSSVIPMFLTLIFCRFGFKTR